MAIKDDLRSIAERAEMDLNAVNDFFEHSRIVWHSFQMAVDAGHKVRAKNPATRTKIDQDGLVSLTQQYTRDYLATFTFRQFVSTFEGFFFDLLHRLLLHNPHQFARCQVEFESILKARDREEIISGLILKQLNDLKYEQLREWFVVLNKTVKLDCPSPEEIDTLAEVKAARDILEHNAGVVNEVYVRKAGRKACYAVGEQIEIDDSYYLSSWKAIKKVVKELTDAAVRKLSRA
jgi:hypothetical protein